MLGSKIKIYDRKSFHHKYFQNYGHTHTVLYFRGENLLMRKFKVCSLYIWQHTVELSDCIHIITIKVSIRLNITEWNFDYGKLKILFLETDRAKTQCRPCSCTSLWLYTQPTSKHGFSVLFLSSLFLLVSFMNELFNLFTYR